MNRFTLDTVIEDEGGNLSVGQVSQFLYEKYATLILTPLKRSLVSLARALVKNAKVIILDEATGTVITLLVLRLLTKSLRSLASVDYETDRKIQDTIAQEFHDRTILCIAREPKPNFPSWLVSI